jgi:regulator of replication initiation timing
MIRVQIAPEMEIKMEVDLGDVDVTSRDYDVQQHKKEVYEAFTKRLEKAFPEGFEICEFEFGLDKGWHK